MKPLKVISALLVCGALVWAGGVRYTAAQSQKAVDECLKELSQTLAARHADGLLPAELKVSFEKTDEDFLGCRGRIVISNAADSSLSLPVAVDLSYGFLRLSGTLDFYSALNRTLLSGGILGLDARAGGSFRLTLPTGRLELYCTLDGSYTDKYIKTLQRRFEDDNRTLKAAFELGGGSDGLRYLRFTLDNLRLPEAQVGRIFFRAGRSGQEAEIGAERIFTHGTALDDLDSVRFSISQDADAAQSTRMRLNWHLSAGTQKGPAEATGYFGPFAADAPARAGLSAAEVIFSPLSLGRLSQEDSYGAVLERLSFKAAYAGSRGPCEYETRVTGTAKIPAQADLAGVLGGLEAKLEVEVEGEESEIEGLDLSRFTKYSNGYRTKITLSQGRVSYE